MAGKPLTNELLISAKDLLKQIKEFEGYDG